MSIHKQYQSLKSVQGCPFDQNRKVYIYADVDIDKLYGEILGKSKKIKTFMEENSLQPSFFQTMRNYKNFVSHFIYLMIQRICLDNEAQQFIYKKQLNRDLKAIKKNVFASLEDFMIKRFKLYLQEQALHNAYTQKVKQIETGFQNRMAQLMKQYGN